MMKNIGSIENLNQRIITEGLKFTDFTRILPKKLSEIQELRSWFYVFRVYFFWIFLITIASLIWKFQPASITEKIVVIVLIPVIEFFIILCYMSLFAIGHDCGHYSFSKSLLMNKIVGHVNFGVLFIGFNNWKIAHNQHHIYSQLIEKETTWTKGKLTQSQFNQLNPKEQKNYLIGYTTPWGIILGFWVTVYQYIFFEKFYKHLELTPMHKKQVKISTTIMLLLSLGLLLFYVFLGGLGFYFMFHIIPFAIGSLFAVGIPLVQHAHSGAVYFTQDQWSPVRGQVLATYNVRFPKIFEYALCDINLHITHHLNTKIPWYNLKLAHQIFNEKFPDFNLEYNFSFTELKNIWKKPFLELDPNQNYYCAVAPKDQNTRH